MNARSINEVEVWLSADGLGRAAIARRSDGLLCIYVHWKLAPDMLASGRFKTPPGYAITWIDDDTPLAALYEDIEPKPGIYGTVDDARREIRSLPGFFRNNLKA
jgi:hypothetical protein